MRPDPPLTPDPGLQLHHDAPPQPSWPPLIRLIVVVGLAVSVWALLLIGLAALLDGLHHAVGR